MPKSPRKLGKLAAEDWRRRLALPISSKNDYTYGSLIQLLDYEPKGSDQVPLLLIMKEDRLALVKAVDSGDTDLGNLPAL